MAYKTNVTHWDQKGAVQKVKNDYEATEDLLEASYERLLPALKEKISAIQKAGSKVCTYDMK
jgi:hypothetical protein